MGGASPKKQQPPPPKEFIEAKTPAWKRSLARYHKALCITYLSYWIWMLLSSEPNCLHKQSHQVAQETVRELKCYLLVGWLVKAQLSQCSSPALKGCEGKERSETMLTNPWCFSVTPCFLRTIKSALIWFCHIYALWYTVTQISYNTKNCSEFCTATFCLMVYSRDLAHACILASFIARSTEPAGHISATFFKPFSPPTCKLKDLKTSVSVTFLCSKNI